MPSSTRTSPSSAQQEKRTEGSVEKKGEVHKVGNLTRDPELRFAPSGVALAYSGLAVERPKVPGDWSGEKLTEFYELTMFRDLAENSAISLTKGTRVVVVGNAELEHWTDDQGKQRTTKRVLVNAIGPDLRWARATIERPERRGPTTSESPAVSPDDEEPF